MLVTGKLSESEFSLSHVLSHRLRTAGVLSHRLRTAGACWKYIQSKSCPESQTQDSWGQALQLDLEPLMLYGETKLRVGFENND